MTWDEAVNNRYLQLVRDLGYTVDIQMSADTVPRVTYTTTGADWIERARELDYLQNDIRATAEAYSLIKADEERYKRKENEIMKKEFRTKELPVNLGRFESDIDLKANMSDAMYHPEYVIFPAYDRVIFNDPATIILWKDKTKTVVKCGPNDIYDPEKGLAMCLLKKLCGNDGTRFHQTIRKMMESYEPPVEESESFRDIIRRANEKLKEMTGQND